jgi:hypothetical protein
MLTIATSITGVVWFSFSWMYVFFQVMGVFEEESKLCKNLCFYTELGLSVLFGIMIFFTVLFVPCK